MSKLYPYIGPAHLARLAQSNSPRAHILTQSDAVRWFQSQPDRDDSDTITATFVILPDGLWIADRHSEHVACARGADVLSAGEITFEFDPDLKTAEVVHITNQSTGYCPEPSSWPEVESVLDSAGIAHPNEFSVQFIFRRCNKCRATNIVKDGWYECAMCGADLPKDWNFDQPNRN